MGLVSRRWAKEIAGARVVWTVNDSKRPAFSSREKKKRESSIERKLWHLTVHWPNLLEPPEMVEEDSIFYRPIYCPGPCK